MFGSIHSAYGHRTCGGVFSSTSRSVGIVEPGTSGPVCVIASEVQIGHYSEGSEQVLCVLCKWVTWELGSDMKYTKTEHEYPMYYSKQKCKQGRSGNICISNVPVASWCPPSDPEPPAESIATRTN